MIIVFWIALLLSCVVIIEWIVGGADA